MRRVRLGGDVDVVACPRCASNVEKRLGIDELDMVVIQGSMELRHVESVVVVV